MSSPLQSRLTRFDSALDSLLRALGAFVTPRQASSAVPVSGGPAAGGSPPQAMTLTPSPLPDADPVWGLLAQSGLDGKLLYVTPQFQERLGHDTSLWVGQALNDLPQLWSPDDAQAFFERFQTLKSTRRTEHFAQRLKHADGSLRWLDTVLVYFPAQNGGAAEDSILLYGRHVHPLPTDDDDLRRLQHAQEQLLVTGLPPAKMASLIVQVVIEAFHQLHCAVMLYEPGTRLLHLAATAGDYAPARDQAISVPGVALVAECAQRGVAIHAPNVLFDERYRMNDPRTRSQFVVPLMTRHGVVGVLDLQHPRINAFDAHTRRLLEVFAGHAAGALEHALMHARTLQANDDLRHSLEVETGENQRLRERAETILGHVRDSLLLLDATGAIRQFNQAFLRQFRCESDAAFQKSILHLAQQRDRAGLTGALQRALQTGTHVALDVTACRADGTTFPAEIVFSAIARAVDAPLVCSVHDLSERHAHEQQLKRMLERERDLMEMKSQFITTVSHEFRTPLMVIQSSGDLLRTSYERMTREQRERHFEKIDTALGVLTRRLEDLVLLGETFKAEAHQELDIPALVRAVADDYTRQSGHACDVRVDDAPGRVRGDELLLHRALLYLVASAMRRQPSDAPFPIRVSTTPGEAHITLGFLPDPGATSRTPTDIGLVMLRRVLEVHQGKMLTYGAATYRIVLPVIQTGQER